MDGPELVKFTLHIVPPMVRQILDHAGLSRDDVDLYLMHQATLYMIEHVRARLNLDDDLVPVDLENVGNTVSSTIPILMHDLRAARRLRPGKRSLLIGFGVGLSWAGCLWTETWEARQFQAKEAGESKAA
jgi:3-oxoacyl-[acyl-carrier-protein] synthase-3